MKFYGGLNEQSEEDIERVKETLKKRCMPFLKEFDTPIYRGYNKGIFGIISRKVARKDRKPRFVPQDIHEELDNLLEKKYGWRPRSNGIFTGDERTAENFGKSYMFFPVGKYQYIGTKRTSDLYDLYDKLSMNKKAIERESNKHVIKLYEKFKKQLLDLIKSDIYNTNGLNRIVKNGRPYEAIFNCESYYLVDTGLQDEMMDWMQEI